MAVIQTVPDVVFKTRVRDELIGGPNPFRWQDRTTEQLFAGKRVVCMYRDWETDRKSVV